MQLDDRIGAPTFEALRALDVSAMETERAARMLGVCARMLQSTLADAHPSTSLTDSEANRLERMAIILAARAALVKALVESQFGSEGDESQIV
jgi:predicted DNA-binding protein (UPF0251 family)